MYVHLTLTCPFLSNNSRKSPMRKSEVIRESMFVDAKVRSCLHYCKYLQLYVTYTKTVAVSGLCNERFP